MCHFQLGLVIAWVLKAGLGVWIGLIREGPASAIGAWTLELVRCSQGIRS